MKKIYTFQSVANYQKALTRLEKSIRSGRFESYTQQKKQQIWNISIDQFALLPYIVSGIVTMTAGDTGVYWIVPALIFSFIKAVIDAWVLLIEIHR